MHSRVIASIFYAISNNFPNFRIVDIESYKLMNSKLAKTLGALRLRQAGVRNNNEASPVSLIKIHYF